MKGIIINTKIDVDELLTTLEENTSGYICNHPEVILEMAASQVSAACAEKPVGQDLRFIQIGLLLKNYF